MTQIGVGKTRRTFFEVRIRKSDVEKIVMHEGMEMRIFEINELLKEPHIVPWDLYGIFLHAKRECDFQYDDEDED